MGTTGNFFFLMQKRARGKNQPVSVPFRGNVYEKLVTGLVPRGEFHHRARFQGYREIDLLVRGDPSINRNS
jgi:hypothetical protein